MQETMTFSISRNLHNWWRITAFLLHFLLIVPSFGLNTDGILLLSFKYSVLSDPLSVLESWKYEDETPCSWNGVTCTGFPSPGVTDAPRVISLVLPNSQLLGSIPTDLGLIEHLSLLDLSNNFLNGSLPISLFNVSELKTLALSNNVISGELSQFVGQLKSLQLLNLSDNALTGKIPQNLTTLPNLTVLSLSNNYFYGGIPSGFEAVEVLDLSSNLINDSLPLNFGGDNLNYLNLSYNKLTGEIPPKFSKIPANATVDLSFNNLTGEVPESKALKAELLSGNLDLCGKPLKNPCSIASTLSTPPNVSTITSPPAIAAKPKTIESSSVSGSSGNDTQQQEQSKLRPGAIAGIIVGDLAGIGILFIIFLYVCQLKKKNNNGGDREKDGKEEWSLSRDSKEATIWSCFRRKGENGEEGTSETTSSDTEEDEKQVGNDQQHQQQQQKQKGGSLVTVDGETELELETLLKASAYILGATGSSIVYKAVLEDGTMFAVRRIGESGVERIRDFANQVRVIAKLRHPNLVRIRGYYWGADEKLVIYDYVSNGSLANAGYRRQGSSPYQLPWEARLRIARGVARGLTYLHEKKHVHGNLKPSNILLCPNMEPKIGDFGLGRLVLGDNSYKVVGSARHFGSKRSSLSRDSLQDLPMGASPSASSTPMYSTSPYLAPESLKNLKPNPKWDVYSFGIVLLELLTGKIFSDKELEQWNTGFVVEERNRILRMADVAIRTEVEGKEDTLMSCFKLGFSCASLVPQKRPSMKEVVQVLEKIPSLSHS